MRYGQFLDPSGRDIAFDDPSGYIVEREYAYTGDPFTTILADAEYLSQL